MKDYFMIHHFIYLLTSIHFRNEINISTHTILGKELKDNKNVCSNSIYNRLKMEINANVHTNYRMDEYTREYLDNRIFYRNANELTSTTMLYTTHNNMGESHKPKRRQNNA